MFCLSVLYLDNGEVPIFMKSVTLGTTFKFPVKNVLLSRGFKPVYVYFGNLASLKYGTEYVLQRNVEKILSFKHKMLHLGHFWVMILKILTYLNKQLHNDNSMFFKRL